MGFIRCGARSARRPRRICRRGQRLPWLTGAVLLGVVVAKLVLVDMSKAEGLARIVAFIGVVLWAYSSKRKNSFDEAANLPFADDETDAKKRDEEASRSKK